MHQGLERLLILKHTYNNDDDNNGNNNPYSINFFFLCFDFYSSGIHFVKRNEFGIHLANNFKLF